MPDPLYSQRDAEDAAYRLSEDLNKVGSLDDVVVVQLPPSGNAVLDASEIVSGEGREPFATGLFTGGEINIVNGGLDVEVLSGTGAIIDSYSTFLDDIDIQPVAWARLQKTITTPTANLIAWILIGPAGNLIEQTTRPTPTDQRNLIWLGLISHDGTEWRDVSTPIVGGNVAHQFYEMIKDVFPPLFIAGGGKIFEQAGFTLDFQQATVWDANRNHHVDTRDPNRQLLGPFLPLSFRYITGSFEVVEALATVIDPTRWENPAGVVDVTVGGGVLTTTIQRLFLDQADQFWLTFGQATYPTFEEARASIAYDTSISTFSSYLTRDCILLGYVISQRAEVDWGGNNAQFIPFVSGQGGGAGAAPIADYLELTDTPVSYAGDRRKAVVVEDGEASLVHQYRNHWRGAWSAGTYEPLEIVLDQGWLMAANKVTTDRPAPQPQGAPLDVYQGASPTSAILAKALTVGNTYTFPTALFFNSYRIYTVVGNLYTISYEISGVITQGPTFTADTTGWLVFTVGGNLVPAGSVVSITLTATEPDPTPTTFTLSYDYITPNIPLVPGVGEINHANQTLSSFRVNKTDQIGDQSVPLATLSVGDVIDGAGIRWSIQSITDNGTWIDFSVAPAQQGTPDGIQDFIFETVTATPITTVIDVDYFLADPDVAPFFVVDGGIPTLSDDGFGVDINVTRASASLDWDPMALSEGSGGGGSGGVDLFTELLDTPPDYVGHANKVVSVKADELALEFTVPAAGSGGQRIYVDGASFENNTNDVPAVVDIWEDLSGLTWPVAGLDIAKSYELEISFNGEISTTSPGSITRAEMRAAFLTGSPVPVSNPMVPGISTGDVVGLGGTALHRFTGVNSVTMSIQGRLITGSAAGLAIIRKAARYTLYEVT